jgi:RNA polymerase sigma-70 factor (ECF subfamily)
VFRIAHNRGLSHLARRRLPVVPADEEIPVVDGGLDPEASLVAGEQGMRLQRAIARLPVSYRQVVTLALEGLSYTDIAEVLGVSESNVGVRLTRARQVLRRWLRAEGAAPRNAGAGSRVRRG